MELFILLFGTKNKITGMNISISNIWQSSKFSKNSPQPYYFSRYKVKQTTFRI